MRSLCYRIATLCVALATLGLWAGAASADPLKTIELQGHLTTVAGTA